MEGGAGRGRGIATRDWRLRLDDFAHATSLGADLPRLEGRSVVLVVGDMAKAAAALIELDGWARRIVLCPPGFDMRGLEALIGDAEADALVYDGDVAAPESRLDCLAPCRLPLEPLRAPRGRRVSSEWVMPTSGTSGPPKMVVHTSRHLDGRLSPRAVAALGDVLRHSPLRRPADLLARAGGDGIADAERRRRERRRVSDPARRSGREAHFRHAVALAQGSHERAGAPHRARDRPSIRRDRRRFRARRIARALSRRAHPARLRLDRGRRRLRGRGRQGGISRLAARSGRRGRR